MDLNQPPNKIHSKKQKINKKRNIVHTKYNTLTVTGRSPTSPGQSATWVNLYLLFGYICLTIKYQYMWTFCCCLTCSKAYSYNCIHLQIGFLYILHGYHDATHYQQKYNCNSDIIMVINSIFITFLKWLIVLQLKF